VKTIKQYATLPEGFELVTTGKVRRGDLVHYAGTTCIEDCAGLIGKPATLAGSKVYRKGATDFKPNYRVDGPDTPSNGERANRAALALKAYIGSEEPDEANLSDLLSDLRHLADRDGIDFAREFERATARYLEEA
jgi:hypothetical protein